MEKEVFFVYSHSKRGYDQIAFTFDEEEAREAALADMKHLTAQERKGTDYILECYVVDVQDGETAEEALSRVDEETGNWPEPVRSEYVTLPPSTDFELDAHKMYNAYNWDTITELMDGEIREKLNREYAPCEEEYFLMKYLEAHLDKYGKNFAIN